NEVRAPLGGQVASPLELALAANEPAEHLGEQTVVAPLLALGLADRVEGLGSAHRGALSDLSRDQASLLQSAQVRPERVRMQRESAGDLANRDGPCGAADVPVDA